MGWTPEVPSRPPVDVLPGSSIQGEPRPPIHPSFRTRPLAVKRVRLVKIVAVEARQSVMHPAGQACPNRVGCWGVDASHASRRTSATSNMVSDHPPPAFQRQTNRILTDAWSLLFLIGHVEATCPGYRFHCEVNLGPHLRSLSPTPPKEQIQEKHSHEVFLKNV